MRRRFPSVSALEFRCCKEIPTINQKLTFSEIISYITRHDDFPPRSHRAVSVQVAPFLRDCKSRDYRRDLRAGQTEGKTSDSSWSQIGILIEKNFLSWSAALNYDLFCSKEITDISIINEYFVRIDFHSVIRFATITFYKICVSLFISLQCSQWYCSYF